MRTELRSRLLIDVGRLVNEFTNRGLLKHHIESELKTATRILIDEIEDKSLNTESFQSTSTSSDGSQLLGEE